MEKNLKLLAEVLYMKELMTEVAPTGILSMVADSYDFWSVVSEGLPLLKKTIMARNGTLVIRPDSGDPVDIICGVPHVVVNNLYYPRDAVRQEQHGFIDLKYGIKETDAISAHEAKGLIECLWDIFGGTTDAEGFRTLDSHIGAIYGDSITLARQKQIIERLEAKKFIPTCVLGIGSYTYQYVTRDTHGFAMKGTAVKFAGDSGWTPISKDPVTDKTKKSAKGLMMVKSFNDNTQYELVQEVSVAEEAKGALETLFLNGNITKETTLESIRVNISKINRQLATK